MAERTWDGVLRVRRGKRQQFVFVLEQELLPRTSPATYEPMPLDGYQARMQCRPDSRSDQVLLDLASTGAHPAIALQPDPADWPDSGGDTTGWVVVTLGATTTAALSAGGPFEIELYNPLDPDDVPDTGLDGVLELDPEIVR